jgi:hypothetical protein
LQLASDQQPGPGFFSIFPVLARLAFLRVKRLLDPKVIASLEKKSGGSGEKPEELVLLEAHLERNPHQAPHQREDILRPNSADRDLIGMASSGRLYLPAAKGDR